MTYLLEILFLLIIGDGILFYFTARKFEKQIKIYQDFIKEVEGINKEISLTEYLPYDAEEKKIWLEQLKNRLDAIFKKTENL